MLTFIATQNHQYTLSRWLHHYSQNFQQPVALINYKQLQVLKEPKGCFVFTDIERISWNESFKKNIIATSVKLQEQGCRIINNPALAMDRYALQKTLHNQFRTFKITDDLDTLKYPVFLRTEFDHQTSSQLINDRTTLNAVMHQYKTKYKSLLIVEYIDISNDKGLYEKYSAYCINNTIIPRHVFFSSNWMQKHPDIINTETVKKEREFIEKNPHANTLKDIFQQAHIDYGRIDYGFYQGKLQVWEINTNPHLKITSTIDNAERNDLFIQTAQKINAQFAVLEDSTC